MSLLDPGNGLNGLAQFIATAVIVLFVLAAGWTILRPSEPRQRRFRTRYQPSRPGLQQAPDLKDVGQQLLAVMACSFQPRRVLSRSEYRVFKIVEDYAAVARRGYRVLAQTSLGEILRSTNPNAFRSINSKRVDILVIDRGGWPVLAVEFQGQAHYQGTAAARDAIKKEALRKAGVRYLEVFAADSDEQIQTRVREQLGWKTVPFGYESGFLRPVYPVDRVFPNKFFKPDRIKKAESYMANKGWAHSSAQSRR